MAWNLHPLDGSMDVSAFACGESSLDSFLQRHALGNDRAGLGKTFVLMQDGERIIAGYFTLATGSVRFDAIPDYSIKRLPRYPIPTVHLGRLAVDLRYQGRGLGAALLLEAIGKAAAAGEHLGIFAIDLYSLNDRAKSFYTVHGFVEMLDAPSHLMLSMKDAKMLAHAARLRP